MTPAAFRARLKGRRCYVGLDLSATKDLTAAAAVFPDDEGPGFDVLAAFWCPADAIRERSRRDHVPYVEWSRAGWLTMTPGPTVEYEAVRAGLVAWGLEFDLREIAYDPWNATDLIGRLEKQDGFTCVAMRQGFASLSAPTKSLERAILSRTLRHDGNPVLRWNVANIAVETDPAGNLKLSKKVSTERIDGAAALVMAVDRMDRNASPVVPAYSIQIFGGPHA